MQGRSVILVSHHVQLCAPGAAYVVALDNGRVQFAGSKDEFYNSGAISALVQSTQQEEAKTDKEEKELLEVAEEKVLAVDADESETSSTVGVASTAASVKLEKKPARKLVEEEKRAVGRISREIWETYIWACGNWWYWGLFVSILVVASASPVLENGWLRYDFYFHFTKSFPGDQTTFSLSPRLFRYWSNSALNGGGHTPVFYITLYAIITTVGLIIQTIRWFILYRGSIHASDVLYKRLLESILFADIRFHDTVSRGRVLNRFGKDFEGMYSYTFYLVALK